MPTTDSKTADTETPRFTVDELRERSGEFLGYDAHIVDGAFLSVGKTKEFTVAEAKETIRKWLKTSESPTDETKG